MCGCSSLTFYGVILCFLSIEQQHKWHIPSLGLNDLPGRRHNGPVHTCHEHGDSGDLITSVQSRPISVYTCVHVCEVSIWPPVSVLRFHYCIWPHRLLTQTNREETAKMLHGVTKTTYDCMLLHVTILLLNYKKTQKHRCPLSTD